MKRLLILVVVALLGYSLAQKEGFQLPDISAWTRNADDSLQTAYDNRQSDLQVKGEGIVKRVLSDDLKGSRHQRFLLQLATGQTVLVAHNIDLAPRIERLRMGDKVAFHGEYEWNSKGGVIHWTHHDPRGRHVAGWLKHAGRTYQ